jgi:hypothetical protein
MAHAQELLNSTLNNLAASPWFLSFVYTSSGSTVAPIPGAKPQSGFKVTRSGDTPPSATNARTRCMIVSTLSMQPGSQLTQPAWRSHANQPHIHSVSANMAPDVKFSTLMLRQAAHHELRVATHQSRSRSHLASLSVPRALKPGRVLCTQS